jgi:hypothetical protein
MHEVIQNGSKDMEFWNQPRTSLEMDETLDSYYYYNFGEQILANKNLNNFTPNQSILETLYKNTFLSKVIA